MDKNTTYLVKKEQYKTLLIQLVNECDSVRWLRCALVFLAGLNDQQLFEHGDVCKLVKCGGTCHE